MTQTNITRLLDSKHIPYHLYEFPALKYSALEVANIVEVDPYIVFKTIVVMRPEKGKPILAVVPGPVEVDLKALARTLGEKKVILPTENEAENLTGLQAGGISPLALLNKGFQVILDLSIQVHPEVIISAGQRGMNIRMSAIALIDLTHARIASITREPGDS
jgi:Cys-tRNA(Pro)/Cys-tRNA(Cys) deacylase